MNAPLVVRTAFALILGLLSFCASAGDAYLERQIFERINEARRAYGVPELVWDRQATSAAKGHSEDMAKHSYMDHYSPTPGKHTLGERVLRAGVSATYFGENVFRDIMGIPPQEAARRMVAWWLNSPLHEANIRDPNFTHLGVGSEHGTYRGGANFVTTVFIGRAITSPRLVLETKGGEVTASLTGVNISSARLFLGWRHEGEISLAEKTPIENTGGNFTQRIPLPKNTKVEVLVGRGNAATDLWRVDTTRMTVEPPPYY